MGLDSLMLALVTGATGLVGRHLVDRLLREGSSVRVLVREAPLKRSGWNKLEVMWGDVRNADVVKQAARACDVIYHLAAAVHGSDVGRARLWDTNVQGTANVARAALECGVKRLVYTSSVAVYGGMVPRHGIDETSDLQPDSPYGLSKFAAERTLIEERGLPAVIVRSATVWGEGASAWAGLIRAIQSGHFRLLGPGKGLHTLMDPTELADALVRCGTTNGIDGRVYVIAGKEAVSLRQLAEMIVEELGSTPLRPPRPVGPLLAYWAFDRMLYRISGHRLPKSDRVDLFLGDRSFNFSRARRELGYEPTYATREIVARTVSWMRDEGLLHLTEKATAD
jgi:nucleoside-diphosphate-sugar epimerase